MASSWRTEYFTGMPSDFELIALFNNKAISKMKLLASKCKLFLPCYDNSCLITESDSTQTYYILFVNSVVPSEKLISINEIPISPSTNSLLGIKINVLVPASHGMWRGGCPFESTKHLTPSLAPARKLSGRQSARIVCRCLTTTCRTSEWQGPGLLP